VLYLAVPLEVTDVALLPFECMAVEGTHDRDACVGSVCGGSSRPSRRFRLGVGPRQRREQGDADDSKAAMVHALSSWATTRSTWLDSTGACGADVRQRSG